FDLGEYAPPDPLFPYSVGKFGSGASAAFDPTALRAIGGFDTALGPATPALGGEDLDAFLQIILAGHRLVYEPRSLVRHHHRREYAELRRNVPGRAHAVKAPSRLDPANLLGAPLRRLREDWRDPLLRNGYALIVNIGATSLLGFLYWLLAAHLYPRSTVGLGSAAINLMQLL